MRIFFDPQAFLQAVEADLSVISQQLEQQLTEPFGGDLHQTRSFWKESGTQAVWLQEKLSSPDNLHSPQLLRCIQQQDPGWRESLTETMQLSLWIINGAGGGLYLLEGVALWVNLMRALHKPILILD